MSTGRQNPGPPWLASPGLPAEQRQAGHGAPLDVQAGGQGLELVQGCGNPSRFDGLPFRSRHSGPPGRLLARKAALFARRAEEVAEELAQTWDSEAWRGERGRGSGNKIYSYTHYS